MIGMLLAAATATAPPIVERTPNLYHQPAHCGAVVDREVARQKVAFNGHPPMAQYAVLRELDGCSVPTPVGYHPDYLEPTPPRREGAPSNRR